MSESINKIDTSYWKTCDKSWVECRKKEWTELEGKIAKYKHSKKNLNVIKNYFLTGKMPNWGKFQNNDDYERHLDIFMFLWLHPSWDIDVLQNLRELYFRSEMIELDDLCRGYEIFLSCHVIATVSPYLHVRQISSPCLAEYTEVMFQLLFESRGTQQVKLTGETLLGKKRFFKYPRAKVSYIGIMGSWLRLTKIIPSIHNYFLLQYDAALEWWYESFDGITLTSLGEDERRSLPYCKFAMHSIHEFDTELEKGSPRSELVIKVRRILDDKEFFPEFKQLWLDIKSGNYDEREFEGIG